MAKRILLASGCSYSLPTVSPRNWRTQAASTRKPWYVTYRFIDPAHQARYPSGKLVSARGMNCYVEARARRASTEQLLLDIKHDLEVKGYNPITNCSVPPAAAAGYIISPFAMMGDALEQARERLEMADSTLNDIKVTLRGFASGAKAAGLSGLPISQVCRRHVLAILDQCKRLNPKWSPARFNKYKANLSMVWTELVQVEAVDSNIIRDIRPQKGAVKKKRQTLTLEERRIINAFLHKHYRRFWIFLQCFFHAGGRITELMRLQGKHVDLKRQTMLVLVKKGRQYVEKELPVKDIAVPFWEMALEGCAPQDYIFSEGLQPGVDEVSARQITRRWASHVKGKKESRSAGKHQSTIPRMDIEVTADFYSLKHSNLDEIAALLDLEYAARAAGHANTKMVERHYAVNEDERKMQRLRQVGNVFA